MSLLRIFFPMCVRIVQYRLTVTDWQRGKNSVLTKGSSHTIGKKKLFSGIAEPGVVNPPPPSRRHFTCAVSRAGGICACTSLLYSKASYLTLECLAQYPWPNQQLWLGTHRAHEFPCCMYHTLIIHTPLVYLLKSCDKPSIILEALINTASQC